MGKNREPDVPPIRQVAQLYDDGMLVLFIPLNTINKKQLKAMERLFDRFSIFLYDTAKRLGKQGQELPPVLATDKYCRYFYEEGKKGAAANEEQEAPLAKEEASCTNSGQ